MAAGLSSISKKNWREMFGELITTQGKQSRHPWLAPLMRLAKA